MFEGYKGTHGEDTDQCLQFAIAGYICDMWFDEELFRVEEHALDERANCYNSNRAANLKLMRSRYWDMVNSVVRVQ